MGWFEDFFDDTLDVVAGAVVGVSSAAIDTAVKGHVRQESCFLRGKL